MDSATIANILGYTGTVIGSCLMMPQLYTSYVTKKMDEISFVMLVMYIVNSIIWLSYGYLIDSLPLLIANGIAEIVGILLIIMKIKYSRK